MKQKDATDALGLLFQTYRADRPVLDRIDSWYRWDHESVDLPTRASSEHRRLAELSRTPWLGLVVTNVAQTLFVDGYRSPDEAANAAIWQTWQENQMNARQAAIHRAALAYGQSFVTVLPAVGRDGQLTARLRGVSPRRMVCAWQDEVEDEFPMLAARFDATPGNRYDARLYDEEAVYYCTITADGAVEFLEARRHGIGVCPVVRYANGLDLEGRTDGEVEPLIPLAARIDKTDYDRLLVQHFNSWKVRTVSGIDLAGSDGEKTEDELRADAEAAKIRLRQSDILTAADPATKFGTLDETPLDGFIKAHDSDVETLAALAQVPATSLNGKVSNVSADALAELQRGLTQKSYERKQSFGESHAQALRLAAFVQGDDEAAHDFSSEVTWQDMSIKSMSQAVDALGKASQMLQVPPEALWTRIPGVTKSDVDEWRRMRASGDVLARLDEVLTRQQDGFGG